MNYRFLKLLLIPVGLPFITIKAQTIDTSGSGTSKREQRSMRHRNAYGKFNYRYLRLSLPTPPEKFLEEARAIDEAVADYILMVLEHKQHPEQAYKSCSGILSLARKAGNARLIGACKRAGEYGIYNYPIVVQILDRNLDRIEEGTQEASMPQHDNIRGNNYYE